MKKQMENKKYKKNPNDIGAFWKNVSKSGLKYYSGKITLDGKEYGITLFKCKAYKEGSKIPYFNAILQDPNWKDNKRPIPEKEEVSQDDIDVEEIPFS